MNLHNTSWKIVFDECSWHSTRKTLVNNYYADQEKSCSREIKTELLKSGFDDCYTTQHLKSVLDDYYTVQPGKRWSMITFIIQPEKVELDDFFTLHFKIWLYNYSAFIIEVQIES